MDESCYFICSGREGSRTIIYCQPSTNERRVPKKSGSVGKSTDDVWRTKTCIQSGGKRRWCMSHNGQYQEGITSLNNTSNFRMPLSWQVSITKPACAMMGSSLISECLWPTDAGCHLVMTSKPTAKNFSVYAIVVHHQLVKGPSTAGRLQRDSFCPAVWHWPREWAPLRQSGFSLLKWSPCIRWITLSQR